MKKKPSKNAALRASYKWHRRIGLWLSLPLIVVVLSGLLLNHSQSLSLDSIPVRSSFLLDWYGMVPEGEPLSLRAGQTWAASLDGSLYLNGKSVARNAGSLRCLLELEEVVLLCTESRVYLVEKSSLELLETLGSESLPPGSIETARAEGGEVILQTSTGSFSSDLDLVSFESKDAVVLEPQEFRVLSEEDYKILLNDWRGNGVTLARLLRDLHSGSLLGALGVAIVDLTGIALLFLVGTGLYNFWKLS